ncbi:MFS transporter [Natrialbaceae archaeon GCM10025810]|uniref:MFS transporter n=1 Tax=Halovalidus salilacus TaxID=3075124 RepID=UPI00360CE7AA
MGATGGRFDRSASGPAMTRSIRPVGRSDTKFVLGMVSGGHFVSHVYLLAFPPLFPLLGAEFDLSTSQLGLLVTAIYVPQLVLQLPLGDLVDRVGAKRVLVAGIAVTALGIALAGLATSYPLLLACAFVSGIGQSVFHPADYALLDTVAGDDAEGLAFGVHTFGGFAGSAAAPVVIGGAGLRFGWEIALLAVGAFGFVYAAALHLTTAPVHARRIASDAAEDGEKGVDDGSDEDSSGASPFGALSLVRRPDMLLVFAFYFASMTAIVGVQSFATVFAIESYGFAESTANTVLTAYLVCTAVGVLVGGVLADRVRFEPIIVGAFCLSAACLWFATAAVSGASLAVALAVFSIVGLAMGTALPARDTFANSFVDPGTAGKRFGFFFTGLSLGAVVSPAVLGAVIDARSTAVAFALVGVVLVLAASIVVVARFELRSRATTVAE